MPSGSEIAARAFADKIGGSFFFLDEERKITRVVKNEAGEVIQFDFTNFEGPDLNADLSRRDFTVNAMAIDLRRFIEKKSLDGLIDLFDGREDVGQKLIRVTKAEVLDEDPLRLPELEPLKDFAPGKHHIYDIFTHSIKTAEYVDGVLENLQSISPEHAGRVHRHLEEPLEHFVTRKAALRFACLLHDIAKSDTYSRDGEGDIHFYGHDSLGAEKAKEICKRFRLSRDTEEAVTRVIKHHMRPLNLAAPGGPAEGFTDTQETVAVILDYYYGKFLKTEEKPFVTGKDLIARGMKPGPGFRDILDEIKERQAEGALKDRNEALDYLGKL